MPSNPYYSDEEAEEILRLAVGRMPAGGGISRENLRQSAAELGISDEALVEAEIQVMERRQEEADRREFRGFQRSKFKKSFWEYLATMAVLTAINMWHAGQPTWSLLVLFFWGIGIFFEAISTFVASSSGYQEAYEKWKRKKRRKADKTMTEAPTQNEVLDRLVLEHEKMGRIQAIKLLRDETGMELDEAKREVDLYVRRNPDLIQ
ncbi:MAG TPA: 2TM domain-containing protein [Fimbriimonas sp.]